MSQQKHKYAHKMCMCDCSGWKFPPSQSLLPQWPLTATIQCAYHNLMTETLTNTQTRCISHRATSAGVNLTRPSAIALQRPYGQRFQPNIITWYIEIARARYFILVPQFEHKTFTLAFIKQLIGLNIYGVTLYDGGGGHEGERFVNVI